MTPHQRAIGHMNLIMYCEVKDFTGQDLILPGHINEATLTLLLIMVRVCIVLLCSR